MVVFPCHVCKTSLQAEDAQAGQQVRCPTCLTMLRVPVAQRRACHGGFGRGGDRHIIGIGRQTERPAARSFSGRLLGPIPGTPRTGRQAVRLQLRLLLLAPRSDRVDGGPGRAMPDLRQQHHHPDPRPLRPADRPEDAADHQAGPAPGPRLRRRRRAGAADPPQPTTASSTSAARAAQAPARSRANNCKSCGMPFTMEGTTLEAAGTSNGFCVASLVLGIIGIPAFCAVHPAGPGDRSSASSATTRSARPARRRRQGNGHRRDHLRRRSAA